MVILTVKELMTKYKVSRTTVYNWIKRGMPIIKLGGTVRFDEAKVLEWCEQNKNRGQMEE